MRKIVMAVATTGVLSGCVTLGPYGTAQFEPTLRKDAPEIQGPVVYKAPGRLLYGIDGFKLVDNIAVKSPLFHGGRSESGQGILLATESKLHFVVWREEKYLSSDWALDYNTIRSLEVRSLGRGRRLVAMVDGEPGVVSFDVYADDLQFIDSERTAALCKLVAARSGKDCKLPD